MRATPARPFRAQLAQSVQATPQLGLPIQGKWDKVPKNLDYGMACTARAGLARNGRTSVASMSEGRSHACKRKLPIQPHSSGLLKCGGLWTHDARRSSVR